MRQNTVQLLLLLAVLLLGLGGCLDDAHSGKTTKATARIERYDAQRVKSSLHFGPYIQRVRVTFTSPPNCPEAAMVDLGGSDDFKWYSGKNIYEFQDNSMTGSPMDTILNNRKCICVRKDW